MSDKIETVAITTDELARQWYAQRAEIERLRAALERIATDDFEDSHAHWAAEALESHKAS